MVKHTLTLTLFFCCAIFTHAQNRDTVNMDQALVQSNRLQSTFFETNRNIQVITAEEIKTLPVKSVPELLTYVSGIDVRQRGPFGTQSDIGMQGGTFEQTLILIDGARMIDPQTGHNSMNIPIPLEAIERIEILKGPAAHIYGLNAITGAINIITKKTTKDFISARIYSGSSLEKDTSNDNTFVNLGVGVSGGFQKGKANQIFSASTDQGNGYRYNTKYKNYRFYSKSGIAIDPKNEIVLQGGYIHNEFGANAFYASPGDKESKESVETATGSAKWVHKGNVTLIPQLDYRYNYDHYIYIQQKPEIYQNRHFTHSISPGIHVLKYTKFGQYAFGLEHRYDNINSNNLGKRERNNTGLSGEILWTKNPNFTATAGIYSYYNSAFGWGFFPGIEMGYALNTNSKIFANLGSAQRIPSFTDLYYKGPQNISNPNLRPENSKNAELGFKKSNSIFSIQASGFVRQISGLIDWVKDSINQPWSPVNYTSVAQMIGVDIHGKIVAYKGNSNFGNLTFRGGYTYLQPSLLSAVNSNYSRYAFENLKHQIIAGFSAGFMEHFNMTVQSRVLQRTSGNFYHILDLHLQYSAKTATLFIDATNISNTQYKEITSVPMPPRWLTFGIRRTLEKQTNEK